MWVCVPPTYGEKSVKVVSQKFTFALHSQKPPEHVLCFLTQSCETRIMMEYGQCSFIHAIRFMNFILNNQLICQHPRRNSRYFVSFFSPFPRNGRGRSLQIRPSASAPLATLSPMAPPKCCTTSDQRGVGVGAVHVVARFQTYLL